jgi:subtilisin family serine protease
MVRSRWLARVFSAALIVSLVAAASPASPFVSSAAAAPSPAGPSRLSARAIELLDAALAQGQTSVVVIVATKTGRGDSVARGLEALGATIINKDNSLGYVSAEIAIDRVKAASALSDVDVLDLDELIQLDPPLADGLDATAPGPTTPSQNSYMPTRDTGAPQFVAANPTYDGRGTVIGILDTGVDLFHPALQTTTTGARKVIDWVTATHPIADGASDKSWIPMTQQVTVVGGSFTVGTDTYTGVTDGAYRFGVFREADLRVAGATEYDIACGADVNRDGDCTDRFALLWRTADDTVWVDASADKSFAGELAMHEYKQNFDIGTFGVDNAATGVRETVPFTIQVDGKNKFVSIGIVSGAHGTHVSGIAAGNDFFGGAFDGAAPGAQIVMVRVCLFINSCTARALIDGMIYAAKQANVDVINMSIGGLPNLNDGNNSRALLYNRLIEQSNVQMFISAGNSGPGINTVGDPSVASLVMSVGAYVHKDTWLNNYGATAAKDDGVFVFSSRGPREDGGFKPEIIAPGAAVSSVPGWQPGQPVAEAGYALPAGYGMFNGTSMAAPQAAGAAALLVSAAKQAGAQHQPDQLRQALKSSARYLPYYQTVEQGNGIIDVGAAWNLLKTNIKTAEIASSVPVNTILSGGLATPNVGVGIHDREGVAPGSTYTRTYTFTRKGGGTVTYDLTWVGNDGTFSSASTLTLGTSATLPVTIMPAAAGLHSAILNVDDPNTVGIDYQTMNTVVAALQLNLGNSFTQTVTGSADRPDTNKPRHFFAVPAGTTMIRVTATTLTGRIRTLRQHPFGASLDSTTATAYCSAGAACQSGQPAGTIQRTFTPTASTPAAGVWEVTLDTSRTSTASPSTYSLTFETFSVTIDPSSWTETGVSIPSTLGPKTFTATNNGAAFTGSIVGTTLTSAYEQTPNAFSPGGAQQVRFIDLPAGTTRLTVQIFQLPGAAADLDLFVYDCTAGPTACVLRGQGVGSTANETVNVTSDLKAGQWKTVVDPFFVPAAGTSYRYLDEYAKAGFGSIATTDVAALRASETSWTADATATLAQSPGAGRFLRGFVNVASGSTVLASAEARFIP